MYKYLKEIQYLHIYKQYKKTSWKRLDKSLIVIFKVCTKFDESKLNYNASQIWN